MTIIAMASESDSLNTFPMRAIALTDGASLVPSDTACSRATCSSEGIGETDDHRDRQPAENDGHRQLADHSRGERPRGVLVTEVVAGHAPLTRQYVNAFTSFEILSALT